MESERIPKTVVFGAAGFLGTAFLKMYRAGHPDCIGADLHIPLRAPGLLPFDLRKPDIRPLRLRGKGYTHALIVAGITKIADCEYQKELTWDINVKGTLELVRQLAAEGIRPIVPSSDNVFDGTTGNYSEESPVRPLHEYARQKAEVDARIGEASGGNYLVVRLSKVYTLHKGDGTMLDEMGGVLASGGSVRAAHDMVFCPILLDDLLQVVPALQRKNLTGLFHVCPAESHSRFEMATQLADAMGVDRSRVIRGSIDEFCPSPPRPHNVSLDTRRLEKEISFRWTPFESCVRVVANNWTAGD